MKKLFLIFAALCCTVSALAQLGTPPGNEIWYKTDNNKMLSAGKYDVGETLCNHGITGHGEKDGHFYIRFDGDIDKIYECAFDDQDDITEISLPNTIVNICEKAFQDCDELVAFHMPNSVHWLGYAAFYHCDNLKEVTFSSNLESIGYAEDSYGVFEECDALESVTLPASVKYIGRNAFYDCNKLQSFSCENLEYIYPQAFYHCDVLKSVNLGTKLKEIQWSSQGNAYGLFEECDELEFIAIPASVTSIGQRAFYDCDKLKVIGIPASVTTLGQRAFYDCDSLKFVAIGSGVTAIPKDAFYNCNELKSVVIDGNGVSIGVDAFNDCEKLESVSFLGATPPASFGEDCFYDCSSSLKYYVLEENYERYNGSSFLNGKVVAGPPYNEIWYTTNNGGTAGYTHSGETPPPLNVYMGTYGVQFFDGNPPELNTNYNCFDGCGNLVSVVLPSSITYIGGSAFNRCPNLVSVSIPSTVTGIGEYAFAYCTSLQSIKFPDKLNYIGGCAFESCKSLQSLTIPSRVNSIPQQAFNNCNNLRSVTILGTIKSIGTSAFSSNNLFEIFYLGEGTPDCDNSIDNNSFNGCPATIYVKDATGRSDWAGRPVRSWRSGKGDGSSSSPLEIGNYPQLYGFSLEVEYMNGANLCAKLTNDITGSTNVLNEDGTPKGIFKQWLPIGGWGNNGYKGEFYGNGYTISGLYFNGTDENGRVGLFGKTDDGANIHDLGVKDSYFYGKTHVGGICGDHAWGQIKNCWNGATVESRGGLVGGIAGSCYIHSTISNCHNVGKVLEGYLCGGICGAVYSSQIADYSISNCISLDTKCSKAYTLADGCPESKIHNVSRKNADAFASGEVCWLLNGYQESDKWRQHLGADGYPTLSGDYFVYYSEVTKKYYNYDDNISGSGTADDPYRIGNKFELQMFADIVNTQNAAACGILTADITMNTDVLDSNGNPNSGTFESWTPMGGWTINGVYNNGYKGEFNGGGHTISGLYFNDTDKIRVGLFGKTDDGANIHDLGVKDSYFRGSDGVAGICGDHAWGQIKNCWNGATVISTKDVSCAGGIAGSCWVHASVDGCYNIGKISNQSKCGGICGQVAENIAGVTYSVSNCVSLNGKCDNLYNLYKDDTYTEYAKIDNVLTKDASAFTSGEVCWILNGNKTGTKWRQQIGTDSYPVLNGNYLVNHYKGSNSYYYNETMCEVSSNHIHNFEMKVVTKCDNTDFSYWHCCDCGKDYSYEDEGGHRNQTKELSQVECSTHILEWVQAVLPTSTTTGRYGHWHCTRCGKYYLNESCTIPATEENLTVPVAKNNEIWYTSTDGKIVTPFNPNSFVENITNNTYGGGWGVIIFDKAVTRIGASAFRGCSSLKSIEIPDNVTSIGYHAFHECSSLKSIEIPDNVTSIADNAFRGCSSLKSIEIPDNVTSIGEWAFEKCGSLQSINIPSGVTSIGAYTFSDCASLQSINIPSGVTSIGKYAFSDCASLQSINIPSGVKSIGNNTFYKCSSLQSINIPSGVKSIGNYAFLDCDSLATVTFNSLPVLGTEAFWPCSQLDNKILDLTDSDKPFIGTSLANYPEGGFTKANYHRSLEKGKWGTIVLPFAPTGGMEGLAFYELKEMTMASGGSLVFTIVEAPKAGVPYLIRNISDSKTDFTLTASNNPTVTVSTTGQTAGDFTLKGSFQQTSLNTTEVPNGNLYYLKDDQFYHANGKINIAPFRAYIEGNGSSQAKSFMLIVEDDGEVDAIPGILNGDGSIDETEAFYDINGRRLSAPVKGQVNVIRTKSGKTVKRMF